MTREEIVNYAEENNCCDIDVIRKKNKNGNIHTDNIDMFDLDEVPEEALQDCELLVMDKDEYKHTILANSCVDWDEMCEEEDKILVVDIK